MWFTKVSLKNPVFATMVMLAFVVLGVFSYQRLKVDQFPEIDFPVVVVTADAGPGCGRAGRSTNCARSPASPPTTCVSR